MQQLSSRSEAALASLNCRSKNVCVLAIVGGTLLGALVMVFLVSIDGVASGASVLASSLASADRRAPRRQSRLVFLEERVWRSLCERLVRQTFAGDTIYEAIKPVQGMPCYVAVIEPESEFVYVPTKMFLTGMMVDADDAAFQHCKNAFDPIRRDARTGKFARAVVLYRGHKTSRQCRRRRQLRRYAESNPFRRAHG